MKKIQGYTGYDYADMILFDDQAPNNLVRVVQGKVCLFLVCLYTQSPTTGVTFQVSRDSGGLSWSNYNTGIDLWRRINKIRSPYLGQNPDLYPRKMHIGYSGVDEATAALLTSGKNRVDLKESARWGYATYVTDNPGMYDPTSTLAGKYSPTDELIEPDILRNGLKQMRLGKILERWSARYGLGIGIYSRTSTR